MRALIILIFIMGCGDVGKKNEFDEFVLRVEVKPYSGYSHELVKVQIHSENDRYPLPVSEGVADSKDKAFAFALKNMGDNILKALEEVKGPPCSPDCSQD
jgi:hypothetical protein